MGPQYDRYESKQERNPLNTKDINGERKNQYGQKMFVPDYAKVPSHVSAAQNS